VETLIKELKTSTSTGADISAPLAHIFNACLTLGVFPGQFKEAIVIPIHKGKDRCDTGNYRPISLLSTLSKILEKAVKNRLVGFLDDGCFFSGNQYGFRTGMGTQDALDAFVGGVTRGLDDGDKCLAIFLDLSKAFDTVSHPILLKKLEYAGVRGLPLRFFDSYLRGRFQRTRIEEQMSDLVEVGCGVPQGSTLGPLLFLIYINDLCNLAIRGRIITFADDTVLLFRAESWSRVYEIAEMEFNRVGSWLRRHLLTLNDSKTKYITFSLTLAGQPVINREIRLHSCDRIDRVCPCPVITKCDDIRYLGLTIDRHLRWNEHLDGLTTRLGRLVHVMRRIRDVLNGPTLKMVYYALCESIISYGTHISVQ
jgi:hypothetical protein